MKSNFVFVYNIPNINYAQQELCRLTDSTNILLLAQSNAK